MDFEKLFLSEESAWPVFLSLPTEGVSCGLVFLEILQDRSGGLREYSWEVACFALEMHKVYSIYTVFDKQNIKYNH